MNYNCLGQTERLSITMENFYDLCNKFLENEEISVIVDAGTMDGGDALFFKNKYNNASVYAIEGLPDNYTNYLINLNEIVAINAVIASYDGNVTYYKKNINGIHGIYDRGEEYGTSTLNLPCYKLSTIMKDYKILNIDILKIDVEGATLDLLKGLEDNLNNIKIIHIETETYPFFKGQSLHNDVCVFLENNNFKLLDITFCEITPNNFQSDSVWINKKYINF